MLFNCDRNEDRKMLRRRLFIETSLAFGSGAVLPRPVHAASVWRIATEYPAGAISGEGVAYFAEAATRLSAGSLNVEARFDAPDGLKSAAMPQAVIEGRVAAADAFTGALAAQAPIFQLSALPFLTSSAADTRRLLEAARPAYEAVLAGWGLVMVYATPWPATGLWSRLPLMTADAIRGLRVRTYDAAGTAVLRAAGASPVQLSFADALPRLRTGELDAVLSSGDGGAGARLWETLPNFTALNYASPLSVAFCASAVLSSLPAATAAAVMQAGRDTETRQFRASEGRLAENDARMRASGVAIADSPMLRAALADAATSVVRDWADQTGEQGRRILAAYHGQ